MASMCAESGARRSSPLKLGVRLSPPSLLLVYRPAADTGSGSSGGGGTALRLRKMPVKSLTALSSCTRVAQELRERHQPYLDTVPQNKLLKMLRILQEGLSGGRVDEILPKVECEFRLDPDEDLNQLPTELLERKKAAMEECFSRQVVRPDQPDFVYDLRAEFDGPKRTSAWDEEDEDEEEGEQQQEDDEDDW